MIILYYALYTIAILSGVFGTFIFLVMMMDQYPCSGFGIVFLANVAVCLLCCWGIKSIEVGYAITITEIIQYVLTLLREQMY